MAQLILPQSYDEQPQQAVFADPMWIDRGLAFAWVASLPDLNIPKQNLGAKVGALTFGVGPRGYRASGFSNPGASNRLITDPAIVGFSGVGTFIAGGISAGDGTLISIGTAGQGVRYGVKGAAAAATYLGVADYVSSISVSPGPIIIAASFFGPNVIISVMTGTSFSSQTMAVGTPTATAHPLRIGTHGSSDEWPGSIEFAYYFTKPLTITELQSLCANPYRTLEAPPLILSVSAGAPAGTTVSPAVGTVALTGYAPTVAQTLNQSVTPGVGSLAITGYAPTIAQPQAVNPGAGTLAITGYAPTVTQAVNQAINPGVGTVAITGYAPAIAQTANQAILPSVGALSITGYAPSVVQAAASQNILPGVGSLTITGYAPSVAQSGTTGSMIGGGGAGPSRKKLDDFLKSLEPKERKKPRKKKRKQAAVVELAPFDPQDLAFVEAPIAPPSDIELLLAQSMPVQVPQMYSAPAAIDQMLMQHRMRQQQQAQTEEDRIIELLLLI